MNNVPMLIPGIDVVAVAGLRVAAPRRRHCDDRAEEDPVRQAEVGVIQVASRVGAIASVALLLLRRRRRRR